MSKDYYNISGDFHLNITVGLEDKSDIPDMRKMKTDLEELFDEVVDNYLDKHGTYSEEIHNILSEGLYREKCYE